jgi:hypothetical protein
LHQHDLALQPLRFLCLLEGQWWLPNSSSWERNNVTLCLASAVNTVCCQVACSGIEFMDNKFLLKSCEVNRRGFYVL